MAFFGTFGYPKVCFFDPRDHPKGTICHILMIFHGFGTFSPNDFSKPLKSDDSSDFWFCHASLQYIFENIFRIWCFWRFLIHFLLVLISFFILKIVKMMTLDVVFYPNILGMDDIFGHFSYFWCKNVIFRHFVSKMVFFLHIIFGLTVLLIPKRSFYGFMWFLHVTKKHEKWHF